MVKVNYHTSVNGTQSKHELQTRDIVDDHKKVNKTFGFNTMFQWILWDYENNLRSTLFYFSLNVIYI